MPNEFIHNQEQFNYDELSPYQRFQLETFGYILPETCYHEPATADTTIREENYIYDTLNP